MKKLILFNLIILLNPHIWCESLDASAWKNIIANTVNNNFGTNLPVNFMEQKKLDNKDVQVSKVSMPNKAAFKPEEMDFKNWGKDSPGRKEKWSEGSRRNFEIIINKVIEAVQKSGSKELPKYAEQLPELNKILFNQVIPAYQVARKNLDFARNNLGNANYLLPTNSIEMISMNTALKSFNDKLNLLSQGITKVDTYQAGPKAAQEILRYLVGGQAKKATIAKSFEKETAVYYKILEKILRDFSLDKSYQIQQEPKPKHHNTPPDQASPSNTKAARQAKLKEIKNNLTSAAKQAYLERNLKESSVTQEAAAKFAQWNNALKEAQDFIEQMPNPELDKLITNFKFIATKSRKLLDELKSRQDILRKDGAPVAVLLDPTIKDFNKEIYPVIYESTKTTDQLASLDDQSLDLLKFLLGEKSELKDNKLIQAKEGLLLNIWKKIIATFGVFES